MASQSTFRPLNEEYCNAITLPSKVGVESRCSKTIEKLLTKRKYEHETTFELLKQKLQEANEEIGKEIWLESKNVKERLNQMEEELEIFLKNTIRNYENKWVELEAYAFLNARSAIKSHEENRSEIIDQFFETLKKLETKRSDRFKIILKDSYAKMGKISFKLPRELLEFFETEILNINEVTLDNHRHYLELWSKLRLQTEDYVRQLLLEIQETEDKYKIAVKKSVVRGLIQKNVLSYQDVFEIEKEEEEIKPQVSTKISAISDVPTIGDLPSTTIDIEVWSRQVQETLDVLESNAKKLVDLYKMAVVNIFNRFFEELQKITDFIEKDDSFEHEFRDEYVQSEVFKPIIEDITQQYALEVVDLQKLWNSITDYMQSNIKDTYLFLNRSSHLWDDHFERINLVKTLVLQDLKNKIEKNDHTAQDFEKKINKTMDQLRQAPSKFKLDRHLAEVNKFLDSIGNLFEKQCEEELKILDKYLNLIDQEINVLLSELQSFLCEFDQKRSSKKSLPTYGSNQSIPLNEITQDNLIPQQMKACKYQVDAVNNWMLGLWEAVRMYMLTCRKELTEYAAIWVKNQTLKIKKRLEVRKAVHKPRYERIKHAMYDVRKKELEEHDAVMQNIEKAVEENMAASRQATEQCKNEQMALLDVFKNELKEVENKAMNAKRSLQILSLIERINDLIARTKKQIEENFKRNEETLDENLNNIKKTMEEIGASIKMFSEGGNYSCEETKMFVKRLAKANRSLPKTYSKVYDEARVVRSKILEEFQIAQSDLVARLENSKEEFEHNESVILKIRKLRNDIHRKVHAVRYEQMKIDSSIAYFTVMSGVNLWKEKNFESMKTALIDCLQRMTTMTDYLIWPDDNEATLPSYIVELEEMIDSSFNEIAEMSGVFYRKHHKIVNEGKVQPTYEAFMEEVTRNYDAYKKQVRMNSLELAEELINQILKLLKTNDQVYDDLMKKFIKKVAKNEEYEELCRKLSQHSSDLQDKRKSLEVEEHEEVLNPNVRDILQENYSRVNTLRSLIEKLFVHVRDKLDVMENMFQENRESSKTTEEKNSHSM